MSKNELHDWEYEIEKLSGNNADKMIDIAQDIYNTAFVRGKNHMTWEQTRWIPVSERLPEESLNSVIGWDMYRERCVFVQYIDGYFQIMGNNECFDIVAWQPLPKPYKEEKESEE
jgi:hypothetical protein